jgi:hypothetical protein
VYSGLPSTPEKKRAALLPGPPGSAPGMPTTTSSTPSPFQSPAPPHRGAEAVVDAVALPVEDDRAARARAQPGATRAAGRGVVERRADEHVGHAVAVDVARPRHRVAVEVVVRAAGEVVEHRAIGARVDARLARVGRVVQAGEDVGHAVGVDVAEPAEHVTEVVLGLVAHEQEELGARRPGHDAHAAGVEAVVVVVVRADRDVGPPVAVEVAHARHADAELVVHARAVEHEQLAAVGAGEDVDAPRVGADAVVPERADDHVRVAVAIHVARPVDRIAQLLAGLLAVPAPQQRAGAARVDEGGAGLAARGVVAGRADHEVVEAVGVDVTRRGHGRPEELERRRAGDGVEDGLGGGGRGNDDQRPGEQEDGLPRHG